MKSDSRCILGLSAYYHDSAAALVRGGVVVAAAQEERFSRRKHDERFPAGAVEYCLREAGIRPAELDYAVFYEKPLLKFDRLLETYVACAPAGVRSFLQALPPWLKTKLHLPREIRKALGGEFRKRIAFTRHHEAHAACAFFPSPFEEAAILTLDGVGEWETASIGMGRGKRIELLRTMQFPHSLGLLYSAFTTFCGFRVNSGEYKLMGLAPYGVPRFAGVIREKLLDLKDDGSFRLDLGYFNFAAGLTMTNRRFAALFGGPAREAEAEITQREMDLAASIQVVTEEILLRMARTARALTGARNLVLAGGVALNCVANGRLLEAGVFEDLWIPSAAGDAGGALGAALFVAHQLLDEDRAEVGSRRSEVGGQGAEVGGRRSAVGEGSEGGGRKPEVGGESAPSAEDGHVLTNVATEGAVVAGRATPGGCLPGGPLGESDRRPATSDLSAAAPAGRGGSDMRPPTSDLRPGRDGLRGSLLGPAFSDAEVRAWLTERGVPFHHYPEESELLGVVAQALEAGKVVGWFQGRMEFGPRALGGRSILGDPRNPAMQAQMNLRIKFRESFRPFAPSVLAEEAGRWFELDRESPYMLLVAKVRAEHRVAISAEEAGVMVNDPDLRKRVNIPRSTVPAVTHVDGSARIQTVTEARNGRFYRLIREFARRTGCPMLVNTSFNVRGEPIVCTPEDAWRGFMATEMDVLVLENCVLWKSEQAPMGAAERVAFLKKFGGD